MHGIVKEISLVILITNSESFKFKTSIRGSTPNDNDEKEVEIAAPLKHLSNFWRTLKMSLINYEVDLNLTWSENCVITDMTTQATHGNNLEI